MNCRVVVEAAVPVYDVETPDEAVRIAISKTGEMLNPDLNYVEINMGERSCPHCGEELDPAFIAADESLVALELEMTVFNVERKEHASRIARKEIGQRLSNIPLDVLEIEVLEDDDEDEEADEANEDDEEADEANEDDEEVAASDDDGADEEVGASEDDEGDHEEFDDVEDAEERTGPAEGDDEVLPEFEELIDE
jgi:uncharacterized protein (UPF0212 family)